MRRSNKIKNKYNSGYVALVSVLVLGAVGVYITISMLLLGLGSSRSSFSSEESSKANAFAHACAEEGLQQIRDNNAYTGTGSLSFALGACEYAVTNTGGENRLVDAWGSSGNTIRRVRGVVNAINPQITMTSWREIADF